MRRAEATANRNAAIEGALSSLGTAALGIDKMIDLYRTPKNKSAEVQKAFNSFQDAQSKIPAGALTKQQSQDLGYNILMGDWN
jgi:hypothetical protein